jgi:hypothetical protein
MDMTTLLIFTLLIFVMLVLLLSGADWVYCRRHAWKKAHRILNTFEKVPRGPHGLGQIERREGFFLLLGSRSMQVEGNYGIDSGRPVPFLLV